MTAALLIVVFSALAAFGFAKAGLYAAVRQAVREHNHELAESDVCLKCIREGLRFPERARPKWGCKL